MWGENRRSQYFPPWPREVIAVLWKFSQCCAKLRQKFCMEASERAVLAVLQPDQAKLRKPAGNER